jgi:hypothetical protein
MGEQGACARQEASQPAAPPSGSASDRCDQTPDHGESGRGRSSRVPHLTLGASIPGAVMVFLPDNRVKARFALRP